MKKYLVPMICAAFTGMMVLSAPAFAQQKTAKACADEWKANKEANQANKITEKAYVTKCRADSAAAKPAATAPAKPVAAPAPAPAPTATAPAATPAAKPAAAAPSGGRAGEVSRIKACGAEWKADKAAGKVPAGMKWPQYWSACDKRKKAAGL